MSERSILRFKSARRRLERRGQQPEKEVQERNHCRVTLRDSATGSIRTMFSAHTGLILALACNLMNNLPAGLVAGSVLAADHVPSHVAAAALIGVNLGPNLSITGSLATILWLAALRREGQEVGAWRFLRLGAAVMFPALILSIGGLMVNNS
jgi:arsenical pump membrane protein